MPATLPPTNPLPKCGLNCNFVDSCGIMVLDEWLVASINPILSRGLLDHSHSAV
ncbi:hypothetical protein IP360_05065 [Helicobacter winghamensis]|uniref:hypothetical protein n=1 Tax=Helicobacter winghamensis TaxID=157268 RepID=UPI00279EBCCB